MRPSTLHCLVPLNTSTRHVNSCATRCRRHRSSGAAVGVPCWRVHGALAVWVSVCKRLKPRLKPYVNVPVWTDIINHCRGSLGILFRAVIFFKSPTSLVRSEAPKGEHRACWRFEKWAAQKSKPGRPRPPHHCCFVRCNQG